MKKSTAKIFATLLRRIARELEGLSDAELHDLSESAAPLLASRKNAHRAQVGKAGEDKDFDFRVAEILDMLRDMSSREEGLSLVKRAAPTKGKLTALSKALDLPVGKRNLAEDIAEKIVESTIGFRIRSAAIRGGHGDQIQNASITKARSDEPANSVPDKVDDPSSGDSK